MHSTLQPGLRHTATLVVDASLTVPLVSSHYESFATMPPVFATAQLVGFVEYTCMGLLADHLEPGEDSVGVDVELTHTSATPIGGTVTAVVEATTVEPRLVSFSVTVHDDEDVVSVGTHRRAIVNRAKFDDKVAAKAARTVGTGPA